jgi:hypothetical protein
MLRTLDEIAEDYVASEVTALWFQDRATSRHHLLYAVAEMCPVEQPASELLESREGGSVFAIRRVAMSEGRTLYAARVRTSEPRDAIVFYRGPGSRRLSIPVARKESDAASTHSSVVVLESAGDLSEEPPNECPLVVGERSEGMAAGLPSRPTALRLLSRLDLKGHTRAALTPLELRRLRDFGLEQLGFDLEEYEEHLGAVHLCFANPLVRSFCERLTSDGRALIFEARTREGKSVEGCELALIDERKAGHGFHVRHRLEGATAIVPLPSQPHELRTILFGARGDCLADDAAGFIGRVVINMELSSGTRDVRLTRPDGTVDEHSVRLVSSEPSRDRDVPSSTTEVLAHHEQRRELRKLRSNGTFFYFPGGPAAREDARAVIRDLLGKARERCLLCDPYLGANDLLEFTPFVRRIGLPVRLLGSAFFLRRKRSKEAPSTYGEELSAAVESLHKQDPNLNVTCRVLLGRDDAPVHDRFLVLDDQVYLLGSSLNEFGQRATTLFRAPDPGTLREALEKYWDERTGLSLSLAGWLEARETSNGEPT